MADTDILKTSIGLDFGDAKNEVKTFGKDVDDLSYHFDRLSESAKGLNISVSDVIKKHLKELSDAKSKTSVDISNTLREKIETAISKAVLNKEIELKDTDGKKLTYDFKLNKTQFQQLNKKIADSFVSRFDVGNFESVPVTLTRAHKNLIRKRFSESINNALSDPKAINFDGLSSKSSSGISLSIGEETTDIVLKNIQNKFVTYLSSPEAVQLAGLKPIKIDSEKLKNITEKIRESIVSVDKQLKIDPEMLEKLPNLDTSFRKFREELRSFVKEVLNVTSKIESISVGTPQDDVMMLNENIEILKKSVQDKVSSFVKEASNVLLSVPLGTIDFSKHQHALGALSEEMSNHLLRQLEALKKGMFAGIGVDDSTSKGSMIQYVKGLHALMEKIATDGITELTGLDAGKIDTAPISTALEMWSTSLSESLSTKVGETIIAVQGALVNANNLIMDNYKSAVAKMGDVSVLDESLNDGIEDLSKIELKDLSVYSDKLESSINSLMDNVINSTVTAVDKFSDGVVSINLSDVIDSQIKLINELIRDSLWDVAMDYRDSLTQLFEATKISGGISNIIKEQADATKTSEMENIKSVVDGLKTSVDGVCTSISSGMTPNIDSVRVAFDDISNKLNTVDILGLKTSVENFVKIIDRLKSDLGVTSDSSVYQGGVDEVSQAATTIKNQADALAEKHSIDLDSAIKNVVDKIESTLHTSISKWKPQKITLDKTLVKGLKKPLQDVIAKFNKSAATQINKSMAGSSTEEAVKKYVTKINGLMDDYLKRYVSKASSLMKDTGSSMFTINTKDLHSDVKRGLATSMKMSVKEFTKSVPTLEGDGDLKNLMNESMRVIFNNFNKLLNVHSKDLIDRYKEAYKKIDVKPDISVLEYTTNQMRSFQEVLVKKIKEVIKEQFNVVMKELKNMKVIPASIGVTSIAGDSLGKAARPASSVTRSVSSSVGAPSLEVSAMPPVSSIPIGAVDSRRDIGNRFSASIRNTARYIAAGALMGAPMSAIYESWNAFKEFDYEFSKATQNMLAKYRGVDSGVPFEDLATAQVEERHRRSSELGKLGISDDIFFDPAQKQRLIEQLRDEFEEFATEGIIKPLHEFGIQYALSQSDVGEMYQISTRRYDNPYEALAQTQAAARIYAVEREEITPQEASEGLEAVASQWVVHPLDKTSDGERQIDKFANMIIKSSLVTQSTAKDILEAQKKAGGVFRSFLPEDMEKERQFATSVALSAIFTQATGRPGSEAGTFWRNLWAEPFRGDTATRLMKFSQSTDPMLQKLNPYTERYGPGGMRYTAQKSGYDMFKDILDVHNYLKDNDRAYEANELISIYAKNRNFGSYAAVATFVQDLNKAIEGVGGLDSFIDSIESVRMDEFDEYLAGISKSTKFKQQQLASTFESTTFEIYEELKPEISHIMDSLTGFLRKVEENAETTANVLEGITKTLIGFGLFELSKKAKNAAEKFMYSNEYAGRVAPLATRKQQLLQRRSELYEKYKPWEDQLSNLGDRSEKSARYNDRLMGLSEDKQLKKSQMDILKDPDFKNYVATASDFWNPQKGKEHFASSFRPYYDFSNKDAVLERYVQRSFLEGMSKPTDLNIAREVLNMEKAGYNILSSNSGMQADYGEKTQQGHMIFEASSKEQAEKIKKAAQDSLLLVGDTTDEKGRNLVKVLESMLFDTDEDKKAIWSMFSESLSGIKGPAPVVIGRPELIPEPRELSKEEGTLASYAHKVVGMGGIDEVKKRLDSELKSIEKAERSVGGRTIEGPNQSAIANMEKYKKEIDAIDVELKTLDDSMSSIKKAFTELGVDGKKLDSTLSKYTKSLKQTAQASNLTEKETEELAKNVALLNRQYQAGAIDARQYVQSLNHVHQTANKTTVTGNKGKFSGLLNGKVGGWIKGKTDGLFGGVLSSASMKPLMHSMTGSLVAGAGMMATTLFADAAMQAISSSMLSDAEKQSHLADNLESMSNMKANFFENLSDGNFIKAAFGSIGYGWNSLKYGMAEAFGDKSAPEFYETLGDPIDNLNLINTAIVDGWDEAIRQFKDSADTRSEAVRRQADIALGKEQRERREKYFENWVDINGDGVKDVDPDAAAGSLSTLEEALSMIDETEGRIKSAADAALVMARAEAALSGERQDSASVLKATEEYYQVNVDATKDALAEIIYYQEEMLRTRGEFARQEEGFLKLEDKRLAKEKELNELYIKQLDTINLKFQEMDARYGFKMAWQQSRVIQDLSSMYVGGQRRDSEDYLKRSLSGAYDTITTYNDYINEIEKELENNNMTAEVRQDQETRLAQYRETVAQAKEQVADIEQSIRLSPLNDISRQQDYASKEYDILKSNLIARGHTSDSSAIRMIQKQQLEENNKYLGKMISELQSEYNKMYNKSGWQAQDILKQIRDLEAQSAGNLANIYTLMNDTATWGLPSDIRPITNYEYETRKNTERAVAIQQGNITVSVKFDTVYARSEEEIQHNIVDPITGALEKVNRDATARLNRQAAGYVSNYR